MIYRVKNWSRFQHYKHRRPPWIRLHRDLLDSVEWHRLPIASKALAPMLWLLASETQEGKIEGDSDSLAFRLRIASKELDEAIAPLISIGWIIESDPASVLLAPCKQDATSEFRVQSTDSLTSNLTDPPRDAALVASGSAPRGNIPNVHERVARIAEAHRRKFVGNA